MGDENEGVTLVLWGMPATQLASVSRESIRRMGLGEVVDVVDPRVG